ncbi:TRF4_3 [Blepharisma stoltei]|uniref:Poly(A) RNA polymerase mitochondrial-like central palm domain-containing protein n=1 Tax=Blepharisma stoltei TaxID=1481888 RepID=A0AAU9JA33_9CILI|nr:unnamed protein product [Blepharisma stoltei]
MDNPDQSHNTSLLRAASDGDYEELCELLSAHKIDKNILNQSLYLAVSRSQSTSDHLHCVEALLNSSANPSHKDSGVSLLMHAAKMGQIQLADLLIRYGAPVDDKDNESRTPLMYVCESDYGDNVDVVELLLNCKAQVDSKDANGNTALHKCGERGYVNSMRALLDSAAFFNAQNKDKDTPLHFAARFGHEQCVELLLKWNAKIDMKNNCGKSPYDEASENLKLLFSQSSGTPLTKSDMSENEEVQSESSGGYESMPEDKEVQCCNCNARIAEICKFCYDESAEKNEMKIKKIEELSDLRIKKIEELNAKNEELESEIKKKIENLEIKSGKIDRLKQKNKKLQEIIVEKDNERKEEVEKCEKAAEDLKDELESTKEQILNLKHSLKLLNQENEMLRDKLEEESKSTDKNSKKTKRKVTFFREKNNNSTPKPEIISLLQEDICNFMQEWEAWQQKLEPIFNEICSKISILVEKTFQGARLEPYGSFVTKMHLPSSDIDMVITNVEGDKKEFLRLLEQVLQRQSYVKETVLISLAVVPIIKLKCELSGKTIQMDITVQDIKHTGIQCCSFVNRVQAVYGNIKPIFLILKQLFYLCGYKEPYNGGLSSYSLFLMVASYFQSQKEKWRKRNSNSSKNLGEIFYQILKYYSIDFQYLTPIFCYDPENPAENPFQYPTDQFHKLIVVDPLNNLNNVAYHTQLDPMIQILRLAFMHLNRSINCNCSESRSPLYKMFFDTKQYFNLLA